MEASQILRQQLREKLAGGVKSIPYGIELLDEATGGIRVGESILLIADSGVGKSSLAGWVAFNVAEYLKEHEPGKEVRIATGEMFAHEYLNRLACSTAPIPIPLNHVRDAWKGVDRRLARREQEAYLAQLDYLDTLPLHFIDDWKSNGQVFKGIYEDRQIEKHGEKEILKPGFFVLDYIGLLPNVILNKIKENEEIARASWTLTNICRKVCPGLVLAQIRKETLRKPIESRRPEREDTYGPGQQINNATLILSLYRKDVYLELPASRRDDPKPAELSIKKNRNGAVGDIIKLIYLPTLTKWIAP